MAANHFRFLSLGAAIALAAAPLPSISASYSALCGAQNNCTVLLGAGKLAMPEVSIEKDRILSWSQGGSGTKTDVGIGVASVVLFGLPGLIGFGAKKHDYVYTINYVDNAGNIQAVQVGFKNNVPANQFMMEMMGMTGLAMGEVNKTLQAQIDVLKKEAAEKERIAQLRCSPVLKPFQCSYSKYLEANPSVRAWAQKYPQMAAAEKIKLQAFD